MPLYEYECEACGQRFEVIQKFSDPAPDTCKRCAKGPIRRLMSSPAIQFKGSGFYITDYAQKGKSDASKTGEKTGSDTATGDTAKSDTAKSDTAKSDTAKPDSGSSGTTGSSSKSDSKSDTTGSSTSTPSTGGTSKKSKE